MAKRYENLTADNKWFLIEKKDGTKIGGIIHFLRGNLLEIGYSLVPSERGKGYCSEAVKIMVDYLFLSRVLVRIQATTDVNNLASQRALEKAVEKWNGYEYLEFCEFETAQRLFHSRFVEGRRGLDLFRRLDLTRKKLSK